jgi:hypothetical protein
MECVFCNKTIDIKGKVGRQDACPGCGKDLRCCKQCKFYSQDAYNECKEVSAERIVEKERANFCDFFVLRGTKGGGGVYHRNKEAMAALESLFKKK